MKTRVALVAAKSSVEGVWCSSKGNESGVRIIHLVQGEHVRVDIAVGELQDSALFCQPGVYPLPWKRFERYRVAKQVDDGVDPSPTTVEMVLNGSAESVP